MLDKVRNNVKSFGVQFVIVLVVAAFIGTIFLVWGHGGKSERQGLLLAKVYGMEITYPEYQHEYMQLVKQYRQMYKDRWSDELAEEHKLKQLAFDNVVNQYILLHKAFEWGIYVSEEDVMDHIRSLPVFQMNGKFSPDLYRQRLGMARISAQQFENDIKKHLLFTRIQERIVGGFKVSEDKILEEFAKKHEKIRADYIFITFDQFMADIPINLDELKQYYETHKDDYTHPQQRSIEYLYLNPKDFEVDANITDEEITLHYNQFNNQFVAPKQVKASHILLKSDHHASPEDDANVKAKAVELLEKVKAGEDFHELAKAYSECPSSQRGGDLGYFGKGRMDPVFENAAFALNIGEVSQVVKSSFGYHIIKVEDIKPEHLMPLDEVRDEIRKVLEQEKAKELAYLKAEDLMREIYRGKFVRDLAFEDRVTYKETVPFFKEDTMPEIGRNKEVMDMIFSLEVGKVSRIVETPEGYFIIRLLSIEPQRQSAYEEVETQVEQNAKKEKAKQMAADEAQKIRERLINGADMTNLAKEYGVKVSDTGKFGRGGYVSGLGSLDDQQAQVLFSLQIDEFSPVMENPRGLVIFKIKEKILLNEEDFAQQKDTIGNRLLQMEQQKLFSTWIERVKKEANVEIFNEDLIS